jgi:hypothetical protein
MRWAEHVARVTQREEMHTVFSCIETRGKGTTWKTRRRRDDDTKMDLPKWDGKTSTGMIWLRKGTGGRFLNTVMNLRGFIKCGEFLD